MKACETPYDGPLHVCGNLFLHSSPFEVLSADKNKNREQGFVCLRQLVFRQNRDAGGRQKHLIQWTTIYRPWRRWLIRSRACIDVCGPREERASPVFLIVGTSLGVILLPRDALTAFPRRADGRGRGLLGGDDERRGSWCWLSPTCQALSTYFKLLPCSTASGQLPTHAELAVVYRRCFHVRLLI